MSKKWKYLKRNLWVECDKYNKNLIDFIGEEHDLLEEHGDIGWELVSVVRVFHKYPPPKMNPITQTLNEKEPDLIEHQYYFKAEKK